MPIRDYTVAHLVLVCALFATSASDATVASSLSGPQAAFVFAADGERTSHILRTLNPNRPPNVQGLRMSGVGTGFFVGRHSVLTNFHVAGRCKAVTVGNNTEGEEIAATLLAGDARKDLALLSADDPHTTPAQFQIALDRETGAGLVIVGYPEHGLPVLLAEMDDVVVSPDDLLSEKPNYPFSGAVRRGDSGSPVLDDSGAVLGIVQAKIDTVATYRATGQVVDRIGYAISNSTIMTFLRVNHLDIEPAGPAGGLTPDRLLEKAHSFVRQIGCWN